MGIAGVAAVRGIGMDVADQVMARLLALSGPAYRVAVRVIGSTEGAEDVVQQAYLDAVRQLRSGPPPTEERAWFLITVANLARKHLRTEARLRRRHAAMRAEPAVAPGADPALVSALRSALDSLEEQYRLPVALCYEEDLSQREAALVLQVPESTLSHRLQIGLERLRDKLGKAGYAAAPAAVIAGLAHTAPPVPATLAAALEKLVSGEAVIKGAGATGISATAKGGIAMKIVAGVVAAGVLAGTVAIVNGVGAGLRPAPTALSSPPAAAPAEGKPAPVNDYKGMQEREEVFEFAEKPKVAKDGDKWVIAFASKGKCDATVAILGPDGKIVRHLASGVLGVNAPHPFQQGLLSQKIEWDGLTDDFKKAPAGCKVKVSLGLKPQLDRNLLGPAQNYLRDKYSLTPDPKSVRVAIDGQGNTYVAAFPYTGCQVGQVYDKDGKYVRTFWPPAAKDVEKTGVKLTTTKWGDKVPWYGWFGLFREFDGGADARKLKNFTALLNTMLAASGLDPGQFKDAPWPAKLPPIKPPFKGDPKNFGLFDKWYLGFCVNPDKKAIFGPGGVLNEGTGIFGDYDRGAVLGSVKRDGLLYDTGGYNEGMGMVLTRRTADGKPVPFEVGMAKDGKFYTGFLGTTGGGPNGVDVTEDGTIIIGFYGQMLESPMTPEIQEKVLMGNTDPGRVGDRCKKLEALGAKHSKANINALMVFDRKGNLLSGRAVENLNHYTGNFMDRDGNIYLAQGGILPTGQNNLHGVAEGPGAPRGWGGSILKFRGQGGKYPIGKLYWAVPNSGGGDLGDPKEKAPPDAVEIAHVGYKPGPVRATGLLWAYGGISNLTGFSCECNATGFHLDGWARSWVPNNGVSGVMVVDSNGNFVMRVGQYGNVDDEGIRFASSIRGVFATDDALYVWDEGNVTLSRILLKYGAEETVPAP